MTIMERLTLIRAGYKAAEIREMEQKEVAEPHEPQPMESRDGMEQQPSPAAGPEGPDAAQEETQAPDAGEDARDAEIRRLKSELDAARRQNINSSEKEPYGMDDYIRDVFARRG